MGDYTAADESVEVPVVNIGQAACVGLPWRWWFPDGSHSRRGYDLARLTCGQCDERMPCLLLALEFEMQGARAGMYGGFTPDERDMIWAGRKEVRSLAGCPQRRRDLVVA